jgi:UDP-3-O-[3-hydroxymyristoyl] N-acetylglucosamine deacetylase
MLLENTHEALFFNNYSPLFGGAATPTQDSSRGHKSRAMGSSKNSRRNRKVVNDTAHSGRETSFADKSACVRQQTLKAPIRCTGIALHSGRKVAMTLRPAPVDAGIVFHRTDVDSAQADIPATWDRVVDTRMCTVLGNPHGVTVGTVEHLMAAFAGLGIDNTVVELDGPEVPIMDGSAQPFVFLIECAGVVAQAAPRRAIRVLKPVVVEQGRAIARLAPGPYLSLRFEIDFECTAVARQSIALGLVNGTFCKELARARTFGFLHEVEKLQAAGLARGGSLENAIVVSGDRILNQDGLRYDDEFVRHKALDAVGDLYLAGAPILGTFDGVCSGHATNNQLLRALFADPAAWCYDAMTVEEIEIAASVHHGVQSVESVPAFSA